MYDPGKLKVFCRRVMESAGLPEGQNLDFVGSLSIIGMIVHLLS